MKEKVCVVLVNFKGHSDTLECLESVFKSSYGEFQVVVVDNSPGEESVNEIVKWAEGQGGHIQTKFPGLVEPYCQKPIAYRYQTEQIATLSNQVFLEKLVILKSTINKGFANGNNLGITIALRDQEIKYVWILNNDTVIEGTTMEQLVNFTRQSKTGIIGCKLLYYHNPEIIQAVGGRYNPWFGRVTEIGAHSPASSYDQTLFKMDYVVGASMFVKRECLEAVGHMNESFFLYFEELDWAIRAKKKNWSLGYCNANVYHKVGASTNANAKGNSLLSDFYSARNRILLARMYFPWTLITLYPAFIIFIFNRIRRNQFDRILMLIKILINPGRHFFNEAYS